MFETIREVRFPIVDHAREWLAGQQVVSNAYLLGIALLVLIIWIWARHLRDPRYLERAMARKLEKQKVADIVTNALEAAVQSGKLDKKRLYHYYAKLGRAFNIPDLIPRNHQQLPFVQKPNLHKAKVLCMQRLHAMGVNVADFLKQRRKKDRKARIQAASRKA